MQHRFLTPSPLAGISGLDLAANTVAANTAIDRFVGVPS